MLTESLVGRISFSFRFPQYFTTAIFTGAVQVTICGLWGNCDVLETGAIFKISIYQTWCNVIFLRIIFFKYSILYDGSIFKMYVQDTQSDGDDCLEYQKWSIQFMFKIRISQRIQIYTNLISLLLLEIRATSKHNICSLWPVCNNRIEIFVIYHWQKITFTALNYLYDELQGKC